MINSAFIHYNYMYRWCNYRYASIFIIGCSLCTESLTVYVTNVICIYMDNKWLQIYLYDWSCPIISVHPSSYNTAICCFCFMIFAYVIALCLWLFMIVSNLLQSVFMFIYVGCCVVTLRCWYSCLVWWQVAWDIDVNMFIWLMLLCPTNSTVCVVLLMWLFHFDEYHCVLGITKFMQLHSDLSKSCCSVIFFIMNFLIVFCSITVLSYCLGNSAFMCFDAV